MYQLAGVAGLLFGAWLLYLSPHQRATRAFVVATASTGIAFLLPLLEERLAWWRTHSSALEAVVYVAIGLSTIYFLCVYPRPRGWIGRSRWGAWAVTGAGASLALLLVLRPSLYTDGPLVVIDSLWAATAALFFVMFALDATRAPPGPLRRALILVLASGLLQASVYGGMLVLNDLGARLQPGAFDAPFSRQTYLIVEAAGLCALASLAIVVVHALRSRDRTYRREAAGLLALCTVAFAVTAVVTFATPPAPGRRWLSDPQEVLDGASALVALPILVYALLRHRLFDIDLKLKWTIKRGTVVAVFVAVFFAASQIAQSFLEDTLGWAMGGLIAGLLLFAIAPLQRMADRVAAAALPDVREDLPADRRMRFYRLAVTMALSDGALTRAEEQHLAQLAEELGLRHTEALAVRQDVERELGATGA
ncbi:MAG TPA: hypothetical protein VFH78_07795 [Candidatus Thermoplasmatota archaeon]|nr:hypothetical protein [Candidatus Thermoplasmatota archaeon]